MGILQNEEIAKLMEQLTVCGNKIIRIQEEAWQDYRKMPEELQNSATGQKTCGKIENLLFAMDFVGKALKCLDETQTQ